MLSYTCEKKAPVFQVAPDLLTPLGMMPSNIRWRSPHPEAGAAEGQVAAGPSPLPLASAFLLLVEGGDAEGREEAAGAACLPLASSPAANSSTAALALS